jgi:hypothetical protein
MAIILACPQCRVHESGGSEAASMRELAICLICLLLVPPTAALAQALQKYYLPRPPVTQQSPPVQRVDPYARFREYIQGKSAEEKQQLYERYSSAYHTAQARGDRERMAYYANLMSILLQSGVRLN